VSEKKTNLDRFKFTKREKRGSLVLLIFLIGFMFVPKLYRVNHESLVFNFTQEEIQKVEQLRFKKNQKTKKKKFNSFKKDYDKKTYSPPTPTEPFDPDTMSTDSWLKLGLSERQAEVLISYKNRLNGFYNINQLYSAYVLDSNRVEAWKPFLVFNRKKPLEKKIEINTASMEELKSLRGIGDKLAERIIKYRQKLGGFYSVEQIGEVYGLPLETFESIKSKLTVDSKAVILIDINHIEMKELSAHPYFTFQMAKLIVNYRLHHGPYSSMEDVLKSKGIESVDIKKMEPYINFAP
jgi:competence ComEA-like helix-hairpin-helix protein